MKAVDTNILARIILGDDEQQAELAVAVLRQHVFVPLSVLLETVWLLTSRYRQTRETTVQSLTDIMDLTTVSVEDEAYARWALNRFLKGAAFADMIHLITARHAESFLTFDREVAKAAGPDSPVAVEIPGG